MYSIIVHGGAGEHKDEKKAKKGIYEAAKKGKIALEKNNNALDAVEESIKVLEDNEHFNAGKGSALTLDGEIKMDACIATSEKEIGAVTNIRDIRHPISFARKVLEKTDHVFLGGEEATKLAIELGLEKSNPYTHQRIKQRKNKLEERESSSCEKLSDTVGAVVIDKSGCLVSGTSTGGKTLKLNGRIGDSPIFGAGTYVDENIAASATGDGEAIIKNLVTKSVSEEFKKRKDLDESVEVSIGKLDDETSDNKGSCGVISVDENYNISFDKNTKHLPVAYTKQGKKIKTSI